MPRPRVVLLMTVLVASLGAGCAPEDRDEQLQALARWEDRRLAPSDSLNAMLRGADPTVRRAALRTAGLIGRTEALPGMIERLSDSSQGVRAQAAFSLGLLGGSVAVPPLLRALDDPHVSVRAAALQGLAHQDHDGSLLYPFALDGEPREARAAWTALRNVAASADHDTLVAAIRTALSRRDDSVRWRVLRCAERAADSTLVHQIAPLSADRNVDVRVHALRALAQHTGTDALAAVLHSHERHGGLGRVARRRVLVAELRALGRLAGPVLAADRDGEHHSLAGRTSAILIAGSQDPDPAVSQTALAAMAQALAAAVHDLPLEAQHQESLLPVWRIRLTRAARDRLVDPAPAVRGAACAALGALRHEGAVAELEAMLDDPDPLVAAAAVRALVAVGPRAAQIDRWRGASATLGPVVWHAFVASLTELWPDSVPSDQEPDVCRASQAWAVALEAAAAEDFTVLTAAASLLSRFPGGRSCHRLTRLYARAAALGEGRADVQLAVLAGWRHLLETVDGGATPFDPRCDVPLPADPPASSRHPLAGVVELTDDHRQEVAQVLRQAFDDPDVRIRLAAREVAEATGILPASLIPGPASLHETLPPVARSPQQPPVARPHRDRQSVRCITDRGTFTIALDPQVAPNTCATFLALIDRGFHDDLTFHRVVPDFVIQGGCPRGDGWGGPGWTIRSEWSRRPFRRGTVGIAHSGKDTGGSQWFVCHSDQPHLDGRYTVFGEVIDGMEVVDRIQRGDRYRLERMTE